jgi:hypothetical protein
MDGTRRTKFAIDVRVPAIEAVFAHINFVFHADVTGLPGGMIYTGFQFRASFLAKVFEMIADLSNWRQLKPFPDKFVNLIINRVEKEG